MNILKRLFGFINRDKVKTSQKSNNLPANFVTFGSADLDRASRQMGELYFQCPNCETYERVNDIGKLMLQQNPTYFTSVNCIECNHEYNARDRIQKGTIPSSK